MGIHGLTSFIDNNSHLLKDHKLHDCRVVIDGNNLYHFLYFYCKVRFQFGGDYDIYEKKIIKIFSMFKSCNIDVFVVFDGAYTLDGKKFKTTIGRARDRICAAQRIMFGHRGTLIPCLAQMVFRQTLDKLGIHHVTCDFEADNQLVTLANKWNCPVISNDSDFYIFELTGGFIPLDYIDFRPRQLEQLKAEDADAFLFVQYYHVNEFIKCFPSLSGTVLPLFATMLGNDYVSAAEFKAFYRKKTPKVANKRYCAVKKHQKIVSVLYWLEEKEHKEELVAEVLTFIRPELRNRVTRILTNSINGYRDTEDFESFDLQRYLEGDATAAEKKADCLTGLTGEKLAPWFLTACRCGEIPVFLLNMALLRRVILPTQVEGLHMPASFLTSTVIREVTYSLLLEKDEDIRVRQLDAETQPSDSERDSRKQKCNAEDQDETNDHASNESCSVDIMSPSAEVASSTSSSDNNNDSASRTDSNNDSSTTATKTDGKVSEASGNETDFVEYTRHVRDLRRIAVEPRSHISGIGNTPSFGQIPELGVQDRRKIWLEALEISEEFCEKFDSPLQLFVACLVFWVRKATTPRVTLQHLKAVVLSAVLLHVHEEIAEREETVLGGGGGEDEKGCGGSDSSPTKSKPLASKMDNENVGEKSSSSPSSLPSLSASLSISATCRASDDKLLAKVRDNFRKYYHDPAKVSSRNPADIETFHAMAQLQACIHDAVSLNCLLQHPMQNPRLSLLFNGSFVYTIAQELQLRNNPDLFLAEMLVKGSAITNLFDCVCAEIGSKAAPGGLLDDKSQGKKLCKGAKKKRKSEREGVGSGKAKGVTRRDGEEGEEEGDGAAFYDVNNRFGALMLDCDD